MIEVEKDDSLSTGGEEIVHWWGHWGLGSILAECCRRVEFAAPTVFLPPQKPTFLSRIEDLHENQLKELSHGILSYFEHRKNYC